MRELVEFFRRPPVRIVVGAIFLVIAIAAFVTGGRGILTGVVLTVAGAHSLWGGLTQRRAQRQP